MVWNRHDVWLYAMQIALCTSIADKQVYMLVKALPRVCMKNIAQGEHTIVAIPDIFKTCWKQLLFSIALCSTP